MTTIFLNRRAALSGLVASLTACSSGYPENLNLDFDPGVPSRFRFTEDAPPEVWMHHLSPQMARPGRTMLALSGGGEDGAFGAGLLNGLSHIGERPDPDIVTGISTGALMAPFVFVGPELDMTLRRIYTEHDARDLLRPTGLRGFLGVAISSSEPLEGLIERYVDEDALAKIAQRHQAGKRLFVVTANLDTGRATVWNMGEIARFGDASLFRAVMRASASIPGLFPPVTFEFSEGDRTFRETHVDGGLNMQFFAIPDAALDRPGLSTARGSDLYVIINNRIDPVARPVRRNTMAIMSQALSTMVRSSASESLERAQQFAARTELRLHAAAIGPGFEIAFDPSDRFSLDYMRPLYDYGFERAVSGRAWTV
jgi:hypothetical protein